MVSRLFPQVYTPQLFSDFLGHSEIVTRVKQWSQEWMQGKKPKPLFFYGLTGSGKTALAYVIAKEMNWPLFELNASDLRSKEQLERMVSGAALNSTFQLGKRLILLDEIDGLSGEDRGAVSAILSVIKESNNPIILTANELYSNSKLTPLRSACELLEFKKINYLSIAVYLKKICVKENISFDDLAIKQLAQLCQGDIRAALLDLQLLSQERITVECVNQLGLRERSENIFSVLRALFTSKTLKEARAIANKSETDADLLNAWVLENIPRIFNPQDTAYAMDTYSRGDVLDGRIFRTQYYGFQRYSMDLKSSAAVLSRDQDYHGWMQFQFPSHIKYMFSNSSARKLKKSISLKLAKKLHCSSNAVRQDFYILQLILQGSMAVPTAVFLNLEEEELALLLGWKSSTKKFEKFWQSVQDLKMQSLREKQGRKPKEIEPVEDLQPVETVIDEPGKQTRLF